MKQKIRGYHDRVDSSLPGLKEVGARLKKVGAIEYVRFRGVDHQEGAHMDKNGVVKMLRRKSKD